MTIDDLCCRRKLKLHLGGRLEWFREGQGLNFFPLIWITKTLITRQYHNYNNNMISVYHIPCNWITFTVSSDASSIWGYVGFSIFFSLLRHRTWTNENETSDWWPTNNNSPHVCITVYRYETKAPIRQFSGVSFLILVGFALVFGYSYFLLLLRPDYLYFAIVINDAIPVTVRYTV